MLLQVLLSVAFVAILAGGLLTSALINVKVATNQAVARATGAALDRGTDEFVNYAQLYVAAHGAAATWPSATVTDQPEPICSASATAAGSCGEFATISYAVVGSSATSRTGPDPALNLQTIVNENRIAGTVTATITSADGTVQGSRTRITTLRVFDASPFAVLSGARDATTAAGSLGTGEGDTSGYRDARLGVFLATPNPSQPANVRDTAIRVFMSCANSSRNSNESQPFADNRAPGNDNRLWGISGGTAFEAPCSPTYAFSATPALPSDATPPDGNLYDVSNFESSTWSEQLPKIQGSATTNHP